ncbi:hypothetical protein QA639_04700 [Bradyrhizobium pachyrhizi]|uniref:hypothetical protein n=1 Tax=Bradyrhizobium pachyrhizi TaxID=280333 RepID=UPI0024B10B07|nr:hypothetical protein [Bradyrhizobium pachyrhizi]WFU56830.1 hypothetical protein QA639_04700 [Bradyrhizobium pachyrhizi]
MDFNVSLFEDAANCVDKLADTLAKLTKLVAAAIGSGHDIIKWNEARQTRKKLSTISGMALELSQSRCALLVSTVEDFVNCPGEPNVWESVRSSVVQTLTDVEKLLSQLKLSEDQVVTAPFYADLSLTLRIRQQILSRLLLSPPPVSADEINTVRSFLTKYLELINQLGAALKALNEYIETQKAAEKWPIRGE